jgi:hypothetical protein
MQHVETLPKDSSVKSRAYSLLSRHSYFRGRAADIEFETVDNVLVIQGRLPSFYLKQLLQTLLKSLDCVDRVDNQVDVEPWERRRHPSPTSEPEPSKTLADV